MRTSSSERCIRIGSTTPHSLGQQPGKDINMEGILGEIRLFGGNYAPKGWHLCDGTKFNIKGNEALYSVLGNKFGGDGRTYFNLPKMEVMSNIRGAVYIICITGPFPPRS